MAINPALAINGVEILNQWWYRPDYHAIMFDCSNVDIGVWSANSLTAVSSSRSTARATALSR